MSRWWCYGLAGRQRELTTNTLVCRRQTISVNRFVIHSDLLPGFAAPQYHYAPSLQKSHLLHPCAKMIYSQTARITMHIQHRLIRSPSGVSCIIDRCLVSIIRLSRVSQIWRTGLTRPWPIKNRVCTCKRSSWVFASSCGWTGMRLTDPTCTQKVEYVVVK